MEKVFAAFDGQVLESGNISFQPNRMARKVPEAIVDDTQIDPKLKAKMDWIKATKNVQIAIMQYHSCC